MFLARNSRLLVAGTVMSSVRDGLEHGDPEQTIARFTKAVERFANMI